MIEEPNKYFEGKPCKLGHTLRYAKNNCCVQCHRDSDKRRREKNKKNPPAEISKGKVYCETDFTHEVLILGNLNSHLKHAGLNHSNTPIMLST